MPENPNPQTQAQLEILTLQQDMPTSKGIVRIMQVNAEELTEDISIEQFGSPLLNYVRQDDSSGRQIFRYVVDLNRVKFMSSTARGKMISADKYTVENEKGHLGVIRTQPGVYEFFEISKLDRHFEMETTLGAYLKRILAVPIPEAQYQEPQSQA